MLEQKNQNSKLKNKKAPNDFIKYSALGFQMIAITVIGIIGGIKLDQCVISIEFPLFTMLLSIGSVVFATYYAIKDFLKPQK